MLELEPYVTEVGVHFSCKHNLKYSCNRFAMSYDTDGTKQQFVLVNMEAEYT
jgi:hypothetical protein